MRKQGSKSRVRRVTESFQKDSYKVGFLPREVTYPFLSDSTPESRLDQQIEPDAPILWQDRS